MIFFIFNKIFKLNYNNFFLNKLIYKKRKLYNRKNKKALAINN